MVGPVCPINVYSFRVFLEKTGYLEEFEKKYGPATYKGYESNLWTDADQQIWLWEKMHPLDKKAREFAKSKFSYSICHQIFTIGAILFKRELWSKMGGYSVELECFANAGIDEREICAFCMESGKAIVVAENVLVAHFASGAVTGEVKKYYDSNKSKFLLE